MAKNLIGSKWLDASDGAVITITNPATGAVIDTVPESTKKDCDAAVQAAKKVKNFGSKDQCMNVQISNEIRIIS